MQQTCSRRFPQDAFRSTFGLALVALVTIAIPVAARAMTLVERAVHADRKSTQKLLWTFAGSPNDGEHPNGPLISDASGALYGVTTLGGTGSGPGSYGTAFKLTPGKRGATEQIIWFFGKSGDGVFPTAGLVAGKHGVMYGATEQGGAYGYGTIFKLTPSGSDYTESVLYSFQALGDGADPNGVTLAPDGTLYGTAYSTGAYSVGTVWSLKQTKKGYKFSTLYSFGGVADDGINPDAPVTLDSTGAIYGVDGSGGSMPCSCGTVFKLVKSGNKYAEETLWSFSDSSSDGSAPTAPVVLDSSGAVYTTTLQGGAGHCDNFGRSGCGTVFKLTPTASGYGGAVIWSFGVTANDGQAPNSSVLPDGNGGFYGTTVNGGTYASSTCNYQGTGCGTVFKLVPSGTAYTESVLWDFGASAPNGLEPEGGLLAGPGGKFYGTTSYGGEGCIGGCGTLFELLVPGHR